ncbi:MAG: hypothetical protein ACRDBQ_07285 [Shewanella sp.]
MKRKEIIWKADSLMNRERTQPYSKLLWINYSLRSAAVGDLYWVAILIDINLDSVLLAGFASMVN